VVTNVAAFGAFVDVGVHQDGLVHVSALSKTFVKDPREVVKPGDVVKVKVLSVDVPRQRIGLTLRLDDEVPVAGAPKGDQRRGGSPRPGGGAGGSRQGAAPPAGQRRDGRGGGGGRRPEPEPQGALAEALRRAGLA
jgi:uncharacterized protein